MSFFMIIWSPVARLSRVALAQGAKGREPLALLLRALFK